MNRLTLFVFSTDDTRFNQFISYPNHKDLNIIRITNANTVADAYKNINHDSLTEYNLFIHDDVRMLSNIINMFPLFEFLLSKNPYTLIGVAGAKDYSKSIGWWDNDNIPCGKVDHTKDGQYWTSNFGDITLRFNHFNFDYVNVLDGLFLLMSKDFYIDKKPFQTAQNNHFYDIRASLTADICAVIDFRVLHYSIGELTAGYKEEAERLLSLWDGSKFPKNLS